MNGLFRAMLLLLLVFSSFAHSEQKGDVAIVGMPTTDYIQHVYGGNPSGRHLTPLSFVVNADRSISAVVAGSFGTLRMDQVSAHCARLAEALKRGETVSLTEAQAKRFRPGIAATFEAASAQLPASFTSGTTVVLIRDAPISEGLQPSAPGIDFFNRLNLGMEDALRKEYKSIDPSAHLLVIELLRPNQPVQTNSVAN